MDRENRTQTPESQAPERPADTIRDGSLKASIWRNEGERGAYYATEFARTYKDDEGNLRDSHSFIGGDLLKLSELARKAYDRTAELRREEFREQRKAVQDKTKLVERQR